MLRNTTKSTISPTTAGVLGEGGVGTSTCDAGGGLLSSPAPVPTGLCGVRCSQGCSPSSSSLLRQRKGPGRATGSLTAWAGTNCHIPLACTNLNPSLSRAEAVLQRKSLLGRGVESGMPPPPGLPLWTLHGSRQCCHFCTCFTNRPSDQLIILYLCPAQESHLPGGSSVNRPKIQDFAGW